MSVPPSPPPSSLAHRESIARLLTPLRRIRPTVAYYKLAAHRIPTLWTLYRGLQRHAERKNVGGDLFVFGAQANTASQLKWRIRTLFEAKRHTIQAHIAKAQLERAYQASVIVAFHHNTTVLHSLHKVARHVRACKTGGRASPSGPRQIRPYDRQQA